MKAVICRGFKPNQAALEEWPEPDLSENGVRIAVRSSGVSFANLLVMQGKHQNRQEPPFIPGTEVAGEVIECGSAVRRFTPGQRVVAGLRAGGFAEQAVAIESNVFALPDQVSFDQAVQFPTIYATAYAGLAWRAALQPGETLLVHGAAGASGLAAVELGQLMGARVIATAGSSDKLDMALAQGADIAINYREEDFRQRVLDETAQRGADVIFDPVGGATFDASLRCIAPDGRILPIGFAGGGIPQIPANIVLVKNITVIGLYWGYYMGWAKQAPAAGTDIRVRQAFDTLLSWTAAGRLKPRLYGGYALRDFSQALDAIASREAIGKIVLHP